MLCKLVWKAVNRVIHITNRLMNRKIYHICDFDGVIHIINRLSTGFL